MTLQYWYVVLAWQVHIDKGMKDGQKIPFRGESHQVCLGAIDAALLVVMMVGFHAGAWIRNW